MSMITCYARMADVQFQSLGRSREVLTRLHQETPSGGEVIDVDRAAGVIAWLLSPCKRAEQREFAAVINGEFAESTQSLGERQPNPPLDEIAICIEGRGPNKIEGLDAGYGPACKFDLEEVARYASVLTNVAADNLRQELNFELMDDLHLPIDYWQEEGEEIFTQYIQPRFAELQRFYMSAATAGQLVLVWWT